MNIVGTWKVSHIQGCDEKDNTVLLNEEEYKEFLIRSEYPADRMKERLLAFSQKIKFTEDNFVEMMRPIPEGISQEEINDAVASGDFKIVDGMMVMCSSDPDDAVKWKEEEGQFFVTAEYNFETNEMNWATINVVDDNTLDYMLFRIVRELQNI